VLEKYQLVTLLDEALNQISRKRKGGNELVYFCPQCHHVKRKLEVCIDESSKFFGAFNCWTCSNSGNLYDLLKFSNSPPTYRTRLFPLIKDIKLRRTPANTSISENISLPSEFLPLSKPTNTPEYKNAMCYLKRRNIILEDIFRYNIGFCEDGEYEHRIIVPSYDIDGKLNFFIGRRYYETDGLIPYKKANISLENVIGFESFINYNEPISLVEGVFDAIAIRNNAVPLFGKYPSRKLRESMLIHGTKRVNMVLDNDAIDDSINNCKMMMKLGIDVYLVHLDGKDPSVLGFEKVHGLIRESQQFTEDDLLRHALGL